MALIRWHLTNSGVSKLVACVIMLSNANFKRESSLYLTRYTIDTLVERCQMGLLLGTTVMIVDTGVLHGIGALHAIGRWQRADQVQLCRRWPVDGVQCIVRRTTLLAL